MPHLVVIAGPANSGKMPLAQELLSATPQPVLLHRDLVRQALVTPVDEWVLTLCTAAAARPLLQSGHNVVAVGWNMEPADRELWESVSEETDSEFIWLDTRDPKVHQMIPPLEGWEPARFEQ